MERGYAGFELETDEKLEAGTMRSTIAIRPTEEERIVRRRLLIICGPSFFVAVIYVLFANLYANCFRYTAYNHEQLNLIATRSETISLVIDPNISAVKGYWSSDGLSLHLNGLNDMLVTQSHFEDWADMIFTSRYSDTQAITLDGIFTLPDSIAGSEQRVLDGKISGSILYPKAIGSNLFNNVSVTVNIPVHIELVPPDEVPWTINKILLYATALLGALVFVFTPRILLLYNKRIQNFGEFINPILPDSSYRMGVSALLLLVGLSYGGGLLIALTVFTGSAPASCFADIYMPAVGLIAVALGTIIVTAILKKRRFARSAETLPDEE